MRICLIIVSLFLLSIHSPFLLTDNSATQTLLRTRHFADLQAKIPAPLTVMVDYTGAAGCQLGIFEILEDHFHRVGNYRVTQDGAIFVNSDPTCICDAWTPIE